MIDAHLEQRDRLYDEVLERACLGCMLLDPSTISLLTGVVGAEDFYRESHRAVFSAAEQLHTNGTPVDAFSVGDVLRRAGGLTVSDAELVELITAAPDITLAQHYGKQVEELAARRRLVQAGALIGRHALAGKDAKAAIDLAHQTLLRLTTRKRIDGFEGLTALLRRYITTLEPLMGKSSTQQPTGIPTGFLDLDRTLGGLRRGDMVLLAARPSVGKSSLALSILMNAARYGHPCALVSLEMGKDSLANRMVSMESGINGNRLKQGPLSDGEQSTLTEALGRLVGLPIVIDDSPSFTAAGLRAHIERLRFSTDVALVCVDYLQLMRGPEGSKEGRVQEVSEISRSCKAIARDLNVCLLAVAQLNRQVEHRSDPRPMLSDLRDSGQLEQDADVVIFLHRPDEPAGIQYQTVICTVAKHRNGPLAEFPLRFDPHLTLFRNATREDRPHHTI